MKKPPHLSPCLLLTLALPVLSRRRAGHPIGLLTAKSVTGLAVAGIWLHTRRNE